MNLQEQWEARKLKEYEDSLEDTQERDLPDPVCAGCHSRDCSGCPVMCGDE